MTDIWSLSIAQLATAFRHGDISPVEATNAAFARIEAIDRRVNAFVTLTPELAHRQAQVAQEELARGNDRGPLQGVPIGLKDLYATKGIRTTAHSRVLLDWIPEDDAACTARLRDAGAVLLGKLAMHEFAWGGASFDTPFPPARNPWDLTRVPGGSSSGSGAALAARLCFGAMGSDTGGSIRAPANLCGVAGLKTTYGLVSRYGVVPLSWSLDTCGPMARTVEDCAIMLQVIAGHDPRDPASANRAVPNYRAAIDRPVRELRIGVPRSWIDETEGLDPEVRQAFEEALLVLQDNGVEMVEVDGAPFADARSPQMVIMLAEAYAYHEANLKSRPHDFGTSVRVRLRELALLSAADYIQAQRARSVIAGQIHQLFERVDAVVTPVGAKPAAKFEDSVASSAPPTSATFAGPFNLVGLPAMAVPCGCTSTGLPIGFQIGGRAFEEATILRLAHAYEHATTWHKRAPDLGLE